jgi:hypothetical protein
VIRVKFLELCIYTDFYSITEGCSSVFSVFVFRCYCFFLVLFFSPCGFIIICRVWQLLCYCVGCVCVYFIVYCFLLLLSFSFYLMLVSFCVWRVVAV